MDEAYDVVVIGGGPGGVAAALCAARRGVRALLVEKGDLGGTCLNRGCVPTKTLLAASGRYAAMKSPEINGVRADGASFDFPAIQDGMARTVARLRGGVGQMLAAAGVETIRGEARFTGEGELSVSTPDGQSSSVKYGAAIVATGSSPTMPGFLPQSARILTPEAFLEKYVPPADLLVLGGGATGCEMATMAAQFGARVTIVEQEPRLLSFLDEDVSGEVEASLRSLGVQILAGARLEDVEADGNGVYGVCGGEEVYGEFLLVACGRRAAIDGLDLGNVGVEFDEGGIRVDAGCRTSNASVFAVGDATAGGPLLANWAVMQGRVTAEVATGGNAECAKFVPSCVFTTPEAAICGMTEREAMAAYVDVAVARTPFAHNPMAIAHGAARGFVKKVSAGGRTVGIQIVGKGASEMIHAAALSMGLDVPPPHPTLMETLFPMF